MSISKVSTSKTCRIGECIVIGTSDKNIAEKAVNAYRKIRGLDPNEGLHQVVVGLAVTVDGTQCYVSVDPAVCGRDD